MLSIREPAFSKDFVLVVLGQIISILGAALLRFALSLYVLDITGRADIFAGLLALSSVPLLLSPIGGALADRFNRRNLMVVFDIISGIIICCLFLSLLMQQLSIVAIGIVMTLLALISAMYSPAVIASIPLLVADNKLEQANGIVQAIQALSQVAAPVLGGVLYAMLPFKTLVIVSAILFFCSALLEMFISIPFVKQAQPPSILKDLQLGFLYVGQHTFIVKCIVLAASLNLLLTPFFIVAVPIILRIAMQASDMLYGVAMGVIDFATIIGALSIGLFAKHLRMNRLYRWLFVIALLTMPIALTVTPSVLQHSFILSILIFIGCSIAIAMLITILSIFVITAVQKQTPNAHLGKVMAIITASAQCTAPLGQILYGIIFEVTQQTMYWSILLMSCAVLLLALLAKKMWSHTEREETL
ncbi:MFS transporter [Metasolibacillus sp.]|uniref:MFS transporter n=1 Tax=Metasolibacillus sp. TaxID=2703680 RepID=UPI0025D6B258|nr:MFS transporter [Metasolibacillus sp.]MCT6923005.1 MFS transporter [Metasolibacillus sp.]MCT6939243.1 MFS transporter [Metasolibacillus sp.]